VAAPAVALAAALSLACSYSYSNPAEQLGAGQISGRTVAAGSPAAAPVGGVSVSLRGGAFDVVTHDTGRFTLLPLPVGTHVLLFRNGTAQALRREVTVGLGRDGQPEGVTLGDVAVPAAASVRGKALIPGSGSATGLALDEGTGLTADLDVGYGFGALALGDHRLRFWAVDPGDGQTPHPQWVGGPLPVPLAGDDAEQQKTLVPLTLRPASGTGTLTFRIVAVGASYPLAQVAITGLPGGAAAVPDGDGRVTLELPEGLYRIGLTAPAGSSAAPPPPATAVVMKEAALDLGVLYLVAPGVVQSALLSCVDRADCGPQGLCAAGRCEGWTPPSPAAATLPVCTVYLDIACGGTCPNGLTGECVFLPNGIHAACLACGTCCTPDGVTTLCAPSGTQFCP
jgi:hypothetical protein